MEIDRHVIKAVSADTRLKMLKSLKSRKKMPSELSKETGLSPSTVVEHLRNLEGAGLIRRIETGHKWVYYELTDKGTNIIQPGIPVRFALTFVLGLAAASFGFLKSMSSRTLSAGAAAPKVASSEIAGTTIADSATEVGKGAAQTATQIIPAEWIYYSIIAIGVALLIYSLYNIYDIWRIRNTDVDMQPA